MSNPIYARPPEKVKDHILSVMAHGAPREVSRGERGALVGYLNANMGGDEHRRQALAWLFQSPGQYMSTKSLDNDQWYAISEWVSSWQDPDTLEWHTAETFPLEAALVVTQAIREQVGTPPSKRDADLNDQIEETLAGQIAAYAKGEITLISPDGEHWPDPGEARIPEQEFEPKNKDTKVRLNKNRRTDLF